MSRNSSRKDLDVFEFRQELEVEHSKWTPKTRNSRLDDARLDKYRFLECVAHPSNFLLGETRSPPCVDVDASECDERCPANETESTLLDDHPVNGCKRIPLEVILEVDNPNQSMAMNTVSDSSVKRPRNFSDVTHNPEDLSSEMDTRIASSGDLAPEEGDISSPLAEPSFSNELVGTASSDAVDSNGESSPSTPSSVLAENYVSSYELPQFHSSTGLKMEEVDTKVVLYADYIAYRSKYWPTSLISFSSNSFKIEFMYDQRVETRRFEWGTDDIQNIECQWSRRNKIATVRLQLLARYQDDHSGSEELRFVVHDPDWLHRQEKIMTLDLRYKDLWKTELIVEDVGNAGGASHGEINTFSAGSYFPDFDEPFEDIVYPEGDPDAVSIGKRDVDLLQPETFINDTVIDFYIKYLKNKIPPEHGHRFHFFNSFFFRKLADPEKNSSNAFDSGAAFQRVRKWTRKIDLFGKDYLFIPVNYSLHWSLIVICHPGEVVSFGDEMINKSSKVPCILHMDSIRGTHAGLKNFVQSYLCQEWKERHKEASEDYLHRFRNLRFLSLELPQQENFYDCGLFLLHYVELFVAEAPANFNPFSITKLSNFLNMRWFLPSDVSLKRLRIQRLIRELIENRASRRHPTCNTGIGSSKLLETDKNENNTEFAPLRSNSGRSSSGNSLYCHPGNGIEMPPLGITSLRSSDCAGEGLPLTELFGAGSAANSLVVQFNQYDIDASYTQPGGAMPPVEEEADGGQHHVYSPSSIAELQQLQGLASEPSDIGYTSGLLEAGIWDEGISDHVGEDDDDDDIGYTSLVSDDDDSDYSGMEILEEIRAVGCGHNESSDQQDYPSREIADKYAKRFVASGAIPDNPPEDVLGLGNEENPPSSSIQDAFQSCDEEPGKGKNKVIAVACEQFIVDDSSSDSDEPPPPKKLRLSPPVPSTIACADKQVTVDDSSSDTDVPLAEQRLQLSPPVELLRTPPRVGM